MPSRNYWLNLFSGTTWQEFLDAESKVSGFREGRWLPYGSLTLSTIAIWADATHPPPVRHP